MYRRVRFMTLGSKVVEKERIEEGYVIGARGLVAQRWHNEKGSCDKM